VVSRRVVTVDYAKQGPQDLLMQITVHNPGPEDATLHVLPTLWYRNTWSWGYPGHEKPLLQARADRITGEHMRSGSLAFTGDGAPEILICNNETNTARLFDEADSPAYPKDGINDYVVHGAATVNPEGQGTKGALHYVLTVPAGGTEVIKVRLVGGESAENHPIDIATEFDQIIVARKAEADSFYADATPVACSEEETRIVRQAYAGLLWSKQFFHYDVQRWLKGDPGHPAPPPGRGDIRNGSWSHLNNHEVLLMPDPWEYPWYAAWDLAFHCVTLAHIDPYFAKSQLVLLLREWYMHPNGQIPAYEWNFSDVNPPVHAWAALRVFLLDGGEDFTFLARIFHKLLLNFTWWTNGKDRNGDNLFEGGFMGLDNIAPIDRSKFPPELGYVEQADSTAWMAMYALDLLEMALHLALHDRAYEDVATKFFEHFLAISYAANVGGLWDEEDGYFYDMLHLADGRDVPLKVRSLVGLIPVTAASEFHVGMIAALPEFAERASWYLDNEPELSASVHQRRQGNEMHRLLSVVAPERLAKILTAMFDESGLLSDYGIRSISAYHREHPFSIDIDGVSASVDYEPAESTNNLFGGNSNWRGPIWMPLNALLVEALRKYDEFTTDTMLVEFPTGSGNTMRLREAADGLVSRLVAMFLPDTDGRRPVHGENELLALDPLWRDNIPFHEYFDGDTGKGLGAEHQTGWTALIAHLILDSKGLSGTVRRVIPDPNRTARKTTS
jgi:hypothetical protein